MGNYFEDQRRRHFQRMEYERAMELAGALDLQVSQVMSSDTTINGVAILGRGSLPGYARAAIQIPGRQRSFLAERDMVGLVEAPMRVLMQDRLRNPEWYYDLVDSVRTGIYVDPLIPHLSIVFNTGDAIGRTGFSLLNYYVGTNSLSSVEGPALDFMQDFLRPGIVKGNLSLGDILCFSGFSLTGLGKYTEHVN